MISNNFFITELINQTKNQSNKKEIILNVTNKLEIAFNNKDTFINFDFFKEKIELSYETIIDNNSKITPEIFSFLEELYLSADTSQYDSGSYYTNKTLVNRSIKEVPSLYMKTVIDPSSGTGNFLINILLNLKEHFKNKTEFVSYICKYVFANDLMTSSTNTFVKRLNYICLDLFNESLTKEDVLNISNNIYNEDFLIDFNNDLTFDIVIGNPPYLGTKSLGKDYLKNIQNIFGYTDDLYSLFTIKSLNLLNKDGFFSFVTSNTYFTLKTKNKMRKALVENGLYKINNNNKSHFGIMTNTATFFLNKKNKLNSVEMNQESDSGTMEVTNVLPIEIIKNIDYRFSIRKNKDSELATLFDRSMIIYEELKDSLSNSKKLAKFKDTEHYKKIIEENDVLPLGLIAFIGTGVDFKGNNKTVLHSLSNKKYTLIKESEIKNELTTNDFMFGIQDSKYDYIKAIKGNEIVYVKWNKEMFSYLKEIKAPLRNLHLYGSDMIYCKTSTYELTKVDSNTLCINTAGACFIKPIIDVDIDDLYSKINKSSIKEYIKTNINNSLSFTPNDLKLIPVKIR